MHTIYFDNGSTSFPKAPGVGKAMADYLDEGGYNVNRGVYSASNAIAERVFETREQIAAFFGFSKAGNVIFTSGITQSLNILINGLLHEGDHVIHSSMEHNAVARTVEAAKARGVEVSIADCDSQGSFDLDRFVRLFRSNTKAVVLLHGSNVTGGLLPVKEVGNLCRSRGVALFVDSAQTAGIIPLDMQAMGIDALAFTGHKGLLGPPGIGGFLIRDSLAEALTPIVYGGTGSMSSSLAMPGFLPDKFEPGTPNLPGILGLSAALSYVTERGIESILSRELQLAQWFLEEVAPIERVRIVGPQSIENRTGTVSLDFLERDNSEISFRLDREFGIMTRCGLHCAPLAHRTLGTYPKGTVRFSFGHQNTEAELEYALTAIKHLLKE